MRDQGYPPVGLSPVGSSLIRAPKGTPCSTPPAANFSTKNHHKTMIFEDSEAEILRTPIKIEKLSLWNRTWSEFIMNFEFHGFLGGFFLYFLKLVFFYFLSLDDYLTLLSMVDDYSMFF